MALPSVTLPRSHCERGPIVNEAYGPQQLIGNRSISGERPARCLETAAEIAKRTRPKTGISGKPAFGIGYAPAHHGELIQGVFCDDTGTLRRALVTLPLPDRGSRAIFYPSHTHGDVVAAPELAKVRRAALLALRELSTHPSSAKGGQVEILSDVPQGIGMGSSTSDVTATIRAIAEYHAITLSREEEARLAVMAECASDSIMVDDRVVLFAHRDGTILETFGPRLPPMVVVGCDTQPDASVDTLALPPADYNDQEIGAFQVLRAALRRAVATEDVALLGRVATASARINQRFLAKPNLEPLLAECLRYGGCGIQVAHSGTVAGLIFDLRLPGVQERVQRCVERVKELGLAVTDLVDTRTAIIHDPACHYVPTDSEVTA